MEGTGFTPHLFVHVMLLYNARVHIESTGVNADLLGLNQPLSQNVIDVTWDQPH